MGRILLLVTVGALMAVMLAMGVGPAFAAPAGTANYYCVDKDGTVLFVAPDVPRGGSYAHNLRGICSSDEFGGKLVKGFPPV